MRVDLKQMRIFEVLAEELHFGRTAHRLHTAQPVVSKAISDLEHYVGTRLVERTSRRVALTTAGRAFLGSAKAALEHAELAVRAARSSTDQGIQKLKLGLTIGAAQPIIGSYVQQVKERNPLAQVEIAELDEASLGRAIADGSVDAAIAWDRSIPAGLKTQSLFGIDMKVLLPHGHPLCAVPVITIADLHQMPMVLPSPEKQPILIQNYREYCGSLGYEPIHSVSVATTADLLAIVSGGAGIGHAPIPDGLSYPGIIVRRQDPEFKLGYHLVWSQTSTPVLELLRAIERVDAAESSSTACAN